MLQQLLSQPGFGRWALIAAGGCAVLALVVVVVAIRATWIRQQIEGLFNRPPRPGRPVDDNHYYRPYWLKR